MSSFLAFALKSSKKSAFLWKGVLGPRKHVWRDFEISKDMHVSSQDMALAYDSTLFRESLYARVLGKCLHFFPIPPFVPKTTSGWGEEERSHFHDHNSLLVLPFISLLHEDRFFGFVLVTRWVQMHNIHRRIMFLLVTRNFLPLCPVRPQDLWRWSLGWICQCPSVGGGALPRHPCRLCWEEMWEGSGCHHVFVKQNPSSYTTGPALQGQRSWATLVPLSLACSVDLRKSSCYTVLLLTLRQRIAVRLQLSSLVYPDPLVNSSCNS